MKLVKKIDSNVDNFSEISDKCYQKVTQIQAFIQEGCSYREIARRMGISRRTVAKYAKGDPEQLSRKNTRKKALDAYRDYILDNLYDGINVTEIINGLRQKGLTVSDGTVFSYCRKLKSELKVSGKPIKDKITKSINGKCGSTGSCNDYITRNGIFRYMWLNVSISQPHKEYIYDKYSELNEIHNCVREFRQIFSTHNVPMLYLFVAKYKESGIKSLSSFAKGIEKDIEAVENAVAYKYSNGFVEGTNSRLKMLKRTMYGRCSRKLLEAKLRLARITKNR